jgi:Winged helix DNA-binding domain
VRTWRLAQQRLLQRVQNARLLEVVRDVGGIHAQIQSSAELQVWARVNGVSRDDVRDALWEKRSLVRTWCMRGTLHLLPAEDLPTYVAALLVSRLHSKSMAGTSSRTSSGYQ